LILASILSIIIVFIFISNPVYIILNMGNIRFVDNRMNGSALLLPSWYEKILANDGRGMLFLVEAAVINEQWELAQSWAELASEDGSKQIFGGIVVNRILSMSRNNQTSEMDRYNEIVLILDPGNVTASSSLARKVAEEESIDDALSILESANGHYYGGHPSLLKAQGDILFEGGMYEEAISTYRRVILEKREVELHGWEKAVLLVRLGNALRYKERFDEAVNACRAAILADKEAAIDAGVYICEGLALCHRGCVGDLTKAIDVLEKGERIANGSAEKAYILTWKADCLINHHQNDLGVKYLRQSLSLDPTSVMAHTLLAQAYIDGDKSMLARSVLENLIELDPGNEWAEKQLSIIGPY
jgi:tetratricopeptide (TPR) repeat protein